MDRLYNWQLDTQQMKKIAQEIFEEESQKYGLDDSFFPLTFIEYYSNFIKTGNFNLIRTGGVIRPFHVGGINNITKGTIIIFLSHVKKIKKIEKRYYRLATFCYHELRHSMQAKFDEFSYEGFLFDISNFARVSLPMDYSFEHDIYSYEIGAYLYGIRRAKDFLKNKYPSLYEKEKDDIEKEEKKYLEKYMLYDAADTFDIALSSIRNKRMSLEINKKVHYPLFDIFLKEDGSFRKISEMISDERFATLDYRIVAAVLSSKTFLRETNIEDLSLECLEVLNKALSYTNKVYQNQERFLEEHKITKGMSNIKNLLKHLESQKSLLQKIRNISLFFKRTAAIKLKFMRNEEKRQDHINSIPTYLDNTKKLIKQKSTSGFISVMLLTSGIIFILTILYLLLYK